MKIWNGGWLCTAQPSCVRDGGTSCWDEESSWWRSRWECGQLSTAPNVTSPLPPGCGEEEQRMTDESLLGTWKLSSSERTLWICLFMLDSRSCPPPDPRVASIVLWRTEILFSSEISASSSNWFAPERSVPLSRPSRILQTGLMTEDEEDSRLARTFFQGFFWSWTAGLTLRLQAAQDLFNVRTLLVQSFIIACLLLLSKQRRLNFS